MWCHERDVQHPQCPPQNGSRNTGMDQSISLVCCRPGCLSHLRVSIAGIRMATSHHHIQLHESNSPAKTLLVPKAHSGRQAPILLAAERVCSESSSIDVQQNAASCSDQDAPQAIAAVCGYFVMPLLRKHTYHVRDICTVRYVRPSSTVDKCLSIPCPTPRAGQAGRCRRREPR